MLDVRKLRPFNFDSVVGNERIIELLKNSLKHSFPSFTIFIGQEGIGKTTLSKIVAKHLTCENPFNGLACEECSRCKEANSKVIMGNENTSHIYTFKMSDEGGKNAARRIEEQIKLMPIGGGTKVIILEECQGMIKEAQDLLLPTLEYIPDDTKIIACTTEEKSLQRTFLSRAVKYRFLVPTKKETELLLARICNTYGIKVVGNTVLRRIVEYSSGKPRDSIMELHKLTSQGNELTIELVNNFLNIIDEEYYLEYLNILRGDMGLVLDFIDKLEHNEVSLTDFIKNLNNFMVKLITLRYRKAFLSENIMEKAKNLLKYYDEDDLLKVQSIIAEESPKIVEEEYAKPQFISMSFKIMNRKNEDLIKSVPKSKTQVEREKELALKNQIKRVKEQENKNKIETVDISSNLNLLLQGMDAKIIKRDN